MNKDYTYCAGFSYVAPPKLCKNCRRLGYVNQAPIEGVWWWFDIEYNPETGKCHRYEPK